MISSKNHNDIYIFLVCRKRSEWDEKKMKKSSKWAKKESFYFIFIE